MTKIKQFNLKVSLFFLLIILGLSIPCFSQSENLRTDLPYFKKQSTTYQRWLDKSGIGQYLFVRELDVRDTYMSVFLEFKFSDTDSIIIAYEKLKAVFEVASPLSLEQQLFYKATNIFQVHQTSIMVEIYDTYKNSDPPLFERIIFFDEGKVQVFSSNPRSKKKDIFLEPIPANDGKQPSVEAFKKKYSKRFVFEAILNFASQQLFQNKCIDRTPQMDTLEYKENLRFTVRNLCREVLTDESEGTLCKVLSFIKLPCNWAKREFLTFVFTYEPTDKGYQIQLLIDGKYGSGIYGTVNRQEYLDMEIDFDTYLTDYADIISTKFSRFLDNLDTTKK